MSSINSESARQYRGVVFKHAPPTADFACSSEIVLPGEHSAHDAWQLVFAELRGPRAAEFIGGDVRLCGN